jgi:hypothetical protein
MLSFQLRRKFSELFETNFSYFLLYGNARFLRLSGVCCLKLRAINGLYSR